jgi:hypothetical protein
LLAARCLLLRQFLSIDDRRDLELLNDGSVDDL